MKTLKFKKPKRISFNGHIVWVYINFGMLILLKTNRKFWFSSCLSSQLTNQTKLCSFNCSFFHSFCSSTKHLWSLLSANMMLLAKCLSVKWSYCSPLSWKIKNIYVSQVRCSLRLCVLVISILPGKPFLSPTLPFPPNSQWI